MKTFNGGESERVEQVESEREKSGKPGGGKSGKRKWSGC